MADFETTVDGRGSDNPSVRVWVWGLAEIGKPESFTWGKELPEFIEEIKKHNSTVYFHNLKYDGDYIVWWLLNNGYSKHESTDRLDKLQPNTFKTLYSGMGSFYSMTIEWDNGKNVEFRDSWKKIPMPLARIPSSFGMPESKGELDYDLPRPRGWEPTEEELDYLRRDILIPAEALRQVIENGAKKLTVGSDALHEYKTIMGTKWFNRTFPILALPMDAEIRQAYRGGFTYADPRFSRKRTRSGLVLDVNSLYPHIMYSKPIPYGEPQYQRGKVEPSASHPLTIFAVSITAKLKPNKIPCIQIKGNMRFKETEYLREIKEPVRLSVTNVDWELWNDHYDIEVWEYLGGWRFQCATGLFDAYIDKWAEVKAASVGGQREIAKLFLNSLYGKFATNPEVTSCYPELKDNAVKWTQGPSEQRPPVYTAAGVFITSWARDLTIRAAQVNYATFAYADTDSLHLLTDEVPEGIDVDPKRMGAWKLEYHFESALFHSTKHYLERKHDGTYKAAWAGLPTSLSEKLTFDDVTDGNVLHGKLLPRHVPGGILLVDAPFTIKF